MCSCTKASTPTLWGLSTWWWTPLAWAAHQIQPGWLLCRQQSCLQLGLEVSILRTWRASSRAGWHHRPAQKAHLWQGPGQALHLSSDPELWRGPQHLPTGCSEPSSSVHLPLSPGASGVGRSHIKNALLSNNPEKFMYPPPCKYPARVEGTAWDAFPLTSLIQHLLTAGGR